MCDEQTDRMLPMRDPKVEVCTLPVELSSLRTRAVAAVTAAAKEEQTASAAAMMVNDPLVLDAAGWKGHGWLLVSGGGF